jgi:hypothetical protein
MAEFSYNNTILSSMGVTPFSVNYGYYLLYKIIAKNPPPYLELADYTEWLTHLDKYLRTEITYAQAIQAEQTDKYRSAPPVCDEGDKVWFSVGI